MNAFRLAAGLALVLAGTAATAADRTYAVAGFDRIRAAGPFEVEVRVGGPVSVRASGPQRALDRLEVRAEGGLLTLRPREEAGLNWRALFGANDRMIVRITVPGLRAVDLVGSGDVSVDRARATGFAAALTGSGDLSIGRVEADRIDLSVTGSGALSMAGRARMVRATVSGSGDVAAAGLTANEAAVTMFGSGDLALAVRDAARVTLTGSGDVVISGRPRCTVTRRGSGEVRCGG